MRLGTRDCARWFIALLLVATFGQASTSSPREYRLRFCHTHTNERLDIVYRRGDNYLPEALAALDHYLRDHRTGEVRHFDHRLFDLLYDLTASLNDAGGEIDVVCGYRTPWSNEFLRTRGAHTGVALHSLHMLAEAIDIRLPGIPTSALRDAALRLQRGGVGYYRDSTFVHVDVGRVRRWQAGLSWVRVALGERLPEFVVVAVNAVEEVHLTIRIDHRGAVQDQHWDWVREVDLHVVTATRHGRLHSFQAPIGLVAQHPRRQIRGLLHLNAAVAEVPASL